MLNPDDIKVNLAKRQKAKLCLNSLWGKFAERDNHTQTTLVSDEEKYFELFSGKYEVDYISFLTDKMALVQWNHRKGCLVPPSPERQMRHFCVPALYFVI